MGRMVPEIYSFYRKFTKRDLYYNRINSKAVTLQYQLIEQFSCVFSIPLLIDEINAAFAESNC